MSRKWRPIVMAAACAGLGFAASQPAGRVRYSITDLGALPGGSYSAATSVNQSGHAVGVYTAPLCDRDSECHSSARAFLYRDGVLTDLSTPDKTDTAAFGINASGHVVGYGSRGAFLWRDGVMIDLGALPGGRPGSSVARAINNRVQVVGDSTTAGGATHAFLWQNGVMADLGALDTSGLGYSAYSGVTLLASYGTSLPDLNKSTDNIDRKSTRLNSSHSRASRMPSSA